MEVPEDLKATAVDCFNKRLQFVGMCHRAGVRILAGTDAPGLGTMVSGLALHRELELLCRSGLSPLDALRAATITAAGALRQEHNLGSVASGKLADLILLDADPLVDIRNTRRIFLVMRGGQVVWSGDDKNIR